MFCGVWDTRSKFVRRDRGSLDEIRHIILPEQPWKCLFIEEYIICLLIMIPSISRKYLEAFRGIHTGAYVCDYQLCGSQNHKIWREENFSSQSPESNDTGIQAGNFLVCNLFHSVTNFLFIKLFILRVVMNMNLISGQTSCRSHIDIIPIPVA